MKKINFNFSKQTKTLKATALSTQDFVSSYKLSSDICELFELLEVIKYKWKIEEKLKGIFSRNDLLNTNLEKCLKVFQEG